MSTTQAAEHEDGSADIGADAPRAARKLDPNFKRNLKIIGGVAAVLGILLIFLLVKVSGSSGQQATGGSQIVTGATTATPADNMTEDMRAKVQEKQRAEAAQAAKLNQSYIPPDAPTQTEPVKPVITGGPGESSYTQGAAAVYQQARMGNAEEDSRRREGLNRMMIALTGEENQTGVRQSVRMSREDAATLGEQQLRQTLGGNVSLGAAGVTPGAGVRPGGAVPAAGLPSLGASGAGRGREFIAGLSIAVGQLASDIRVPAGSTIFASARVSSGPAAGGYMVGQAKVVDEGLEITFTQLRVGDSYYRIDAIALDEQTASSAIAGNVDRRLLQRYALPVALAAAQGFFNAKSQTGTTVVNVNNGVGGVQTPAPTSEQARSAGISAGLQIVGQDIQRQQQAPIVVSREANFPIGILFRQPVTEEARR